jgi:hypothetical protein
LCSDSQFVFRGNSRYNIALVSSSHISRSPWDICSRGRLVAMSVPASNRLGCYRYAYALRIFQPKWEIMLYSVTWGFTAVAVRTAMFWDMVQCSRSTALQGVTSQRCT